MCIQSGPKSESPRFVGHSFVKCQANVESLSPSWKFRQIVYNTFHHTLNMLPRYLVKFDIGTFFVITKVKLNIVSMFDKKNEILRIVLLSKCRYCHSSCSDVPTYVCIHT